MKNLILLLMLVGIPFCLFSQAESKQVRSGNKLYNAEKYVESEVAYRKALLKNPVSYIANYNLANSLYQQSKFKEAIESYKKSESFKPEDKIRTAAIFHNMGNAYFSMKQYKQSVEAYKSALKLNPSDNDTRYNLAYAQLMLKKEEQKKEKEKNDKNESENSNMSKNNAQQLLNALMQDERSTLDKAKKQNIQGKKDAEKNW